MHPTESAARQVAAEAPPLGDFPAKGVMLFRGGRILQSAKRAGWPSAVVTARITQAESVDAGGWHRPAREQDQPVTIYPESWARRRCELTGKKLTDVCTGRYDPDA